MKIEDLWSCFVNKIYVWFLSIGPQILFKLCLARKHKNGKKPALPLRKKLALITKCWLRIR